MHSKPECFPLLSALFDLGGGGGPSATYICTKKKYKELDLLEIQNAPRLVNMQDKMCSKRFRNKCSTSLASIGV